MDTFSLEWLLCTTGPAHSNDRMFVVKSIATTHQITRPFWLSLLFAFCSVLAEPQWVTADIFENPDLRLSKVR